jgi:hypothetical protein
MASRAPPDFSDEDNVWSTTGTWLEALFAGVGLISIVFQLQFFFTNRRKIQRIAGRYSPLIDASVRTNGLTEGVAPALIGWFQRAYSLEYCLALTPDDRRTGGASGWSKLFTQCQITAEDLVTFGGPTAGLYPATMGKVERRPVPQADLIVEDSRVLYGLSGDEFTTLLIYCGFSVSWLSNSRVSNAFLGNFEICDYGAFSQQARFDPHLGSRYVQENESLERSRFLVPVKRCIDYAFGILRSPLRGKNEVIIISQKGNADTDWWRTPITMKQLHAIRYNLEHLVSISGADMLRYNLDMEEALPNDMTTINKIMLSTKQAEPACRSVLLAAQALTTLEPWSVLPVLQKHFVEALKPLIRPFVGSRRNTISLMEKKLLADPELKALPSWQSMGEQAKSLGRTGDIKVDFFSGTSSTCKTYYESMIFLFNHEQINPTLVRFTLAAKAAWETYDNISFRSSPKSPKESFIKEMMSYLNDGNALTPAPGWAVKVYATYLWGWLNDYIEIDDDLKNKFSRRVFLL